MWILFTPSIPQKPPSLPCPVFFIHLSDLYTLITNRSTTCAIYTVYTLNSPITASSLHCTASSYTPAFHTTLPFTPRTVPLLITLTLKIPHLQTTHCSITRHTALLHSQCCIKRRNFLYTAHPGGWHTLALHTLHHCALTNCSASSVSQRRWERWYGFFGLSCCCFLLWLTFLNCCC